MKAVIARLPRVVDARVRAAAIASLVAQILIVLTGGAVRLTGSGLGCPTWPRCTADSFVATEEMGIHGIIEFGNRLLTFVLIAIAIVMFLFVVRMRRERPELFGLSLALGLGIPAQGVIGGITVLTQLNPWIVGLHFVLSMVLVALATVLVWRVHTGPRGARLPLPRWFTALVHATTVLVAMTITVGIITTGSGPHAGDGGAARNGLDSEFLQHVHSWPAYATVAATILVLLGAIRLGQTTIVRFAAVLLLIEGAQVIVGLAQARLGLPPLLVAVHMLLAACLAAAMTAVVLSLRESTRVATEVEPELASV